MSMFCVFISVGCSSREDLASMVPDAKAAGAMVRIERIVDPRLAKDGDSFKADMTRKVGLPFLSWVSRYADRS